MYRGAERRRTQRSILAGAGRLCSAEGEVTVYFLDVSEGGAMLDGGRLPGPGTRITLRRGASAHPGHVVWVDGHRCGIAFDAPVNPRDVL